MTLIAFIVTVAASWQETLVSGAVDVLGPAVGTAIAGLLSWLAVEAVRWLRGKNKSEAVDRFLVLIENAAPQAIQAVERDSRGLIKGALTGADRDRLREEALEIVKRDLGTPGLALGQQALKLGQDELNDWIKRKLDATLADLKR